VEGDNPKPIRSLPESSFKEDKLPANVEQRSTDKLRVGVIGLNMGRGHAERYNRMHDADLVAVCDKDAAWMEHCRTEYSVPHGFTDFNEMLTMPEIDAVSIAVPTFLHLPMTLAALQHGKHVLIEKPMAMNVAECEQMAAAAREAGKTLMVSLNQRFDRDVVYLKSLIEEGGLGEIYFARTLWRRPLGSMPNPTMKRSTGMYTERNWFNEASKGGGALRDLGAHVIDVALWLMGFPELESATGCAYTKFLPDHLKGTAKTGDADDHSVGFAKFKNGASLQIEASFGQHIDHDELITEVFGTKGGALRWSGRPPKIYGQLGGALSTTEPRLPESKIAVQDEFVASILEGRPPLVTPEHGIASTRIMDAIFAS